jgi:hypothetical protein
MIQSTPLLHYYTHMEVITPFELLCVILCTDNFELLVSMSENIADYLPPMKFPVRF